MVDSPTYYLAIPHKRGTREQSFARLKSQLESGMPHDRLDVRVFDEPAPNHVWSGEMWAAGALSPQSHFLQLQDDVVVCDDFWRALDILVQARPNEVICLQATAPELRMCAAEGHAWATNTAGVIGVAYVVPTPALREFVEWRAALPATTVEAITEDTLLGLWCAVTGRRIWLPIPTIIDHDVTIESTYGNDNHPHRRPEVRWDNYIWRGTTPHHHYDVTSDTYVPHLGCFYESTPRMLAQFQLADKETIARVRCDTGSAEKRRLIHFMKSQRGRQEPVARVLIATPTRGEVHTQYCQTIWGLLNIQDVQFEVPLEIEVAMWSADIVRVRNRFVQHFLKKTEATHLFFVDSDVSFDPVTFVHMLLTGYDFVAAPYARRSTIDLEKVRQTRLPLPPETYAYEWAYRIPPGAKINEKACVEIEGIGLGCALISRQLLEKLDEACPRYIDTMGGMGGEEVSTAGMFNMICDGRALLSEDYSFCERVRHMADTPVMLYLGPGSPVSHWGEFCYQGVVESFGLRRKEVSR